MGKAYEVRMEYVWNNTPATRQQQAGHWLGLPGLRGGA
jgi:hypothetical protein